MVSARAAPVQVDGEGLHCEQEDADCRPDGGGSAHHPPQLAPAAGDGPERRRQRQRQEGERQVLIARPEGGDRRRSADGVDDRDATGRGGRVHGEKEEPERQMHAAHAPVGGDPADRCEDEHARAGKRHEPPDSRHTGHHRSHDQGVRAEPHELRRHRQYLGEPLDGGPGRHQLAGAGVEVHRVVPGHGVGREDDQCGGDEDWQRRSGTLVVWERQPDGERHGDGESEPAAERRAAGNHEKAPEEGATRGQDAAGPCVVGQIRDQREDEGGEEHLPVDRVPLQRPGQRRTGSPGERAPARAERTDAQPARRDVDEHRAQQMRAEDDAECGSGHRPERGHQAEGRRVEHGEEVARPDLRQERNAIHRDQVVEVR